MTKKDSRLLVEPTAIEPAQPQSTCAHSPGANARVRNAGARTRRTHPAYRAHIVCDDSEPAGVTFLGTESLEDLSGRVSMSFQPALNDDFVGLELTFAQRLATTLGVILCTSPFSHRLFIEVQFTGDLGEIQAAFLM